jgi:hypothetical protein
MLFLVTSDFPSTCNVIPGYDQGSGASSLKRALYLLEVPDPGSSTQRRLVRDDNGTVGVLLLIDDTITLFFLFSPH